MISFRSIICRQTNKNRYIANTSTLAEITRSVKYQTFIAPLFIGKFMQKQIGEANATIEHHADELELMSCPDFDYPSVSCAAN